ncbi:MAG TPA: 3-hydroxyacyl-CoA dehydrogenase family protein [Flavisolibacter sp.]
MQIVVICNDSQWDELVIKDLLGDDIIRVQEPGDINAYPGAGAVIDLLFENNEARIALLAQYLPRLVIINSVEFTLAETHTSFVRINGWSTFLSSPLIEASAEANTLREQTETVLARFNKKPEWLPDEAGWITPRVISMIINEAFLSLEEGVSTRNEMDTAMKLGTNYPYGPFEWAEKIGHGNICSLLNRLSALQPRYAPSPMLSQA